MADPVVHITNGIPDSGTGVITTLGETLLDGANVALGATTDLTTAAGAAGTINSHLRTISRDIAGGVVIQAGANTIGAVTQAGAPWSISGSVSITGTVTVSGTVAATQSGAWNITNISGTISLPTGAATAAKQPALGTAGVPSTDVITIQGATSMTPVKVDNSGVTQPISGNVGITGNVNVVQVTSPWVTSISGSVTCIQSGNWTSRCVGNAGGIFDFASTQNVATPGQAILIGGEFNAVPTTITTGNSSPLQLDANANVLVNVKTGTVAATQSGAWSTRLQDGAGNAITSDARGSERPLSVQIIDASGNQITSFGGSGGTASNFGSAFPTAGTAIGVMNSAATAMTNLKVNASNALVVDGSGVTQPISGSVSVTGSVAVTGTFWQTTQPISGTVTANQGAPPWTVKPDGTAWAMTSTSANVNVTNASIPVTGTFWQATQPVSGTVAATQSGTWTVQQGTPPWACAGDVASGSADGGNPQKIGGVANTGNPTAVTNGQRVNAQFDKVGKLIVAGAIRTLKGKQKTSITVATETTVVAAGGAGVFNDVYAFICTNKSVTSVFVDFKDSTAGTTQLTLAVPANDTRGFTVPVDSAIPQTSAANNWTATVSAAVTSIEITALYTSNT